MLPKTQSSYRQSGFTLLEIMVVLTIIGMMLGMATLSSGGNEQKQEAKQQALRLVTQLEGYRNEAVFQNIDLGLAMDEQSTQLLKYVDPISLAKETDKTSEELNKLKENPWDTYQGSLISSSSLPDHLIMGLILEDKAVDFSDLMTEEAVKPAILFLSSDEYTPFKISIQSLYDESFSLFIEGDGFSRFQMKVEQYDD